MAAKNGNGELQKALTALIQSQATLTQTQAQFVAQMSESDKRFGRIEADLQQIKSILIQHDNNLKDLTDAIRQKIGFKSK